MREEFAEAEGQDLVISISFRPWEGMLDLDTIKCVMSILKWLLLGLRVATIYTRRHVFPSSSVFIHSLDLRASTYQRTSQSEPSGNTTMACSSWEPLSHTQDRLCANHSNWLSAMLFLNFQVLFSLLSPTVFYLNHAGVLTLPANT